MQPFYSHQRFTKEFFHSCASGKNHLESSLNFRHVMTWFIISLFALLYERNQSIFVKRELPKNQQNDANTSGTTPT